MPLWTSTIALAEDTSKPEGKIIGPPQMFQITVFCDAKRLQKIEASLKKGQQQIIRYDYTLYITFKNHKIIGRVIRGRGLSEVVKKCIIDRFQKSVTNKKTPRKGITPIRVAFPAIITPKSN